MARYKKKPVVIEAIQWNGNSNLYEIEKFIGKPLNYDIGSDTAYEAGQAPPFFNIFIETLEGVMKASPFDWIIKGVNGEFYPCKPDIFEATYEMEGAE